MHGGVLERCSLASACSRREPAASIVHSCRGSTPQCPGAGTWRETEVRQQPTCCRSITRTRCWSARSTSGFVLFKLFFAPRNVPPGCARYASRLRPLAMGHRRSLSRMSRAAAFLSRTNDQMWLLDSVYSIKCGLMSTPRCGIAKLDDFRNQGSGDLSVSAFERWAPRRNSRKLLQVTDLNVSPACRAGTTAEDFLVFTGCTEEAARMGSRTSAQPRCSQRGKGLRTQGGSVAAASQTAGLLVALGRS